MLALPDGESLLVVGGARTGRSTTLARLARAWRDAHPDGWVGAAIPRRSTPLVELAEADAIATGPPRSTGTDR